MIIKRVLNLSETEILTICDIHKKELSESVLNKFGAKLLKLLYYSFPKNRNNIVIIAKHNKKVVGYLVATTNINNFIKKSFLNNFFSINFEVLRLCLTNFKLFPLFIGYFFIKHPKRISSAELQFIAINHNYQNRGLGKLLLSTLNREFRKENVFQYYVGTKALNQKSNIFYKKNKFKQIYSEEIFGDVFNYYLSPKLS